MKKKGGPVSELKIVARRDGAVGSLALEGEARLETVEPVRAAARRLKGEGAKHLIVDASRLSFIDSASVGTMLEAVKEYEAAGGLFVLHGVSPRLRKMIEGMGLVDRLRLAPDAAAARALLA